MFPVAFLAGDRALAIAIMSYNGGSDFGLIGDYDAMPDLDAVAEGIEASLAELVTLAETPRTGGSRSLRGFVGRPAMGT